MPEELWTGLDTTPAAIEEALRDLLSRWHASEQPFAPARVLNLVTIVDGAFRGEVENRLERVGRFHPSRAIVCSVEPGRTTLDARAAVSAELDPRAEAGSLAVARERVGIRMGPRHLHSLDSIVGPLLLQDVATLVWAPHGHHDGLRALRRHAQVVLVDSLDAEDVDVALELAGEWARDMYVVDLAWLRSTPWRERVAAAFDPPAGRRALREIAGVTVRHRSGSAAAAVLFCGWLASRLGWRAEPLVHRDGVWAGRARTRRSEVALELREGDPTGAPGLSGVTVATAAGESLSLDRGPGGLHARRVERDGAVRDWTVLGASRGEAGILGEGVRQALLRDVTYEPALDAARRLVAR